MDQRKQIIDENNNSSESVFSHNELGMGHYNNLSNNNSSNFQRRLNTQQYSLNNNRGATGKQQSPNAPSLLSRGNKDRNKTTGGSNGVADNLRNKLNTKVKETKDNAVKKGTDALKKSANPYAKATGRIMDAYQKRKQKKKEKEEKSQE